jgi:hypothetical protein
MMITMIINCYVCGKNRGFLAALFLEFSRRGWGKSREASHVAGVRPEI